MTHELAHIFNAYKKANAAGVKAVLATVVSLSGSSYRRPGVRMLLLENGSSYGAVSGGCVEKEVFRQAGQVFQKGIPRMMTYDGRFRLGCEGILYILLEPFSPSEELLKSFETQISARISFELRSYYRLEEGPQQGMGTVFFLQKDSYELNKITKAEHSFEEYRQSYGARMRLAIFGGEHDAVVLSDISKRMGWEVFVVVAADEAKSKNNFPSADRFMAVIPETVQLDFVDSKTAVILMTHSYVKDLKYLLRLSDCAPFYLGILGPSSRRERLLSELMERQPTLEEPFFERIYGPSGIDLGAEGPQEISVSILAEIISALKGVQPQPLRDKTGAIHSE